MLLVCKDSLKLVLHPSCFTAYIHHVVMFHCHTLEVSRAHQGWTIIEPDAAVWCSISDYKLRELHVSTSSTEDLCKILVTNKLCSLSLISTGKGCSLSQAVVDNMALLIIKQSCCPLCTDWCFFHILCFGSSHNKKNGFIMRERGSSSLSCSTAS